MFVTRSSENAVIILTLPHRALHTFSPKSPRQRKKKNARRFSQLTCSRRREEAALLVSTCHQPKNVLRVRGDHAPNLSNMRALACINRIKNFASNTPSEPRFAPVSVKRSNLSEPE